MNKTNIHAKDNTEMTAVPPPPVPQGLREMLKEYPEHIERLQEALNTVIEKPLKATPPLEVAIWALEGRLETFISEARSELRGAEENGDLQGIALGKKKVLLMLDCRSSPSAWKMKNLMDYFDNSKLRGNHGE
jgi:hypothetical protein